MPLHQMKILRSYAKEASTPFLEIFPCLLETLRGVWHWKRLAWGILAWQAMPITNGVQKTPLELHRRLLSRVFLLAEIAHAGRKLPEQAFPEDFNKCMNFESRKEPLILHTESFINLAIATIETSQEPLERYSRNVIFLFSTSKVVECAISNHDRLTNFSVGLSISRIPGVKCGTRAGSGISQSLHSEFNDDVDLLLNRQLTRQRSSAQIKYRAIFCSLYLVASRSRASTWLNQGTVRHRRLRQPRPFPVRDKMINLGLETESVDRLVYS